MDSFSGHWLVCRRGARGTGVGSPGREREGDAPRKQIEHAAGSARAKHLAQISEAPLQRYQSARAKRLAKISLAPLQIASDRLFVQAQALHHRIDGLAIGMQGQAGQLEIGARNCAHRCAIGLVVRG
jgi:hypothetical protein